MRKKVKSKMKTQKELFIGLRHLMRGEVGTNF